AQALAGSGLIVISILAFAIPQRAPLNSSSRKAFFLALLTGAIIALYTIWDKYAVSSRQIPPLLMEWVTSLTRLIVLFPLAISRWKQAVAEWHIQRACAMWIGVLNPLAYLLILIAMTFTAVSYVAPARDISILFGA